MLGLSAAQVQRAGSSLGKLLLMAAWLCCVCLSFLGAGRAKLCRMCKLRGCRTGAPCLRRRCPSSSGRITGGAVGPWRCWPAAVPRSSASFSAVARAPSLSSRRRSPSISLAPPLHLHTSVLPPAWPASLPCSKAFLIEYERGLRVIILTANAIYPDCNNKTQGAGRCALCDCIAGADGRLGTWATQSRGCLPGLGNQWHVCAGLFWQDFPPKDEHSPKDKHSLRVRQRCLQPASPQTLVQQHSNSDMHACPSPVWAGSSAAF
jgi:hypothetical protein